jgi:hypothetical protein
VTPVEAARAAAEAVRSLNHATFAGTGYEWPNEVDAVLVELTALARRLPQALVQAETWLTREDAAGRVGDDTGDDADDRLADARAWLADAAVRAEWLASALDQARQSTAHLTGDAS